MNQAEAQAYKLKRENEIEARALRKASELLNIPSHYFIQIQKDNTKRKDLYEKVGITFNKTPDFAITDGQESQPHQLMLVEVNEPTGGLSRDYGFGAAAQQAFLQQMANASKCPTSTNGQIGPSMFVPFNMGKPEFDDELTNKLKKTYQKYSFKRNGSDSVSINTGLIFCVGDTPNELTRVTTPMHMDLALPQYSALVVKTIKALSGGKLGIEDAFPSRGKTLSFEFCDDYKYMGFVMFIGGGATENRNYMFINTSFIDAGENFVAKSLATLTQLNQQ